MYRRRRTPAREPAFSFDSFLDVVTNVVGIIVRLILVAWVGARAYGMIHADPADCVRQPAAPQPERSGKDAGDGEDTAREEGAALSRAGQPAGARRRVDVRVQSGADHVHRPGPISRRAEAWHRRQGHNAAKS